MWNTRICLTIDLEFWDSPQFFGLSQDKHKMFGNKGCHAILDLFEDFKIESTFFVATEFAQQHPETICRIIQAGHEVASHSCSHTRFNALESAQRASEIAGSKKYLEDQFGLRIKGFRAPGNLIGKEHFVALKDAGYRYDSSFHPALLPRPFDLFKPSAPCLMNGVVEIPISTFAGLPVSWLVTRNTGIWLARLAVRYNRLLGRGAVFYFHSWEFEPLPSVHGVPKYITRATGGAFLEMLTTLVLQLQRQGLRFCRMDQMADEYLNHHSGL